MTDTSAENSHVTGKYASVHAGFVPKHREYYENRQILCDPGSPVIYTTSVTDKPFSLLIWRGADHVRQRLSAFGAPLVQAIGNWASIPDIRYLIHSHGHFDHFTPGWSFAPYGCQRYEPGGSRAHQPNPALALMEYSPIPYARTLSRHSVDDGSLNWVILPLSVSSRPDIPRGQWLFFDIKDEGRSYRVGYFMVSASFALSHYLKNTVLSATCNSHEPNRAEPVPSMWILRSAIIQIIMTLGQARLNDRKSGWKPVYRSEPGSGC